MLNEKQLEKVKKDKRYLRFRKRELRKRIKELIKAKKHLKALNTVTFTDYTIDKLGYIKINIKDVETEICRKQYELRALCK